MNVRMIIAGLIAASAALAGTPAYAAPDTVSNWVKTVNKKLDRTVVFPANGRSGTARATFQRTEGGRAVLVSVRSSDRAVERAARQTVAQLRNLPPMPAGLEGREITLQMLIGDPNNPRAFYKQRETMLASAENSNQRLAARVAGTQLAMSTIK